MRVALPRRLRTKPILYLKARDGLTWNETVVNEIENHINSRGNYEQIETFVYSRYTRKTFLESMLESPFAIVFSPFDIAPGFMLELLEADVPIFALTKRVIGEMNNFREGISGESRAGSSRHRGRTGPPPRRAGQQHRRRAGQRQQHRRRPGRRLARRRAG